MYLVFFDSHKAVTRLRGGDTRQYMTADLLLLYVKIFSVVDL